MFAVRTVRADMLNEGVLCRVYSGPEMTAGVRVRHRVFSHETDHSLMKANSAAEGRSAAVCWPPSVSVDWLHRHAPARPQLVGPAPCEMLDGR
jgi:hypothetical protein